MSPNKLFYFGLTFLMTIACCLSVYVKFYLHEMRTAGEINGVPKISAICLGLCFH